MTSTTWRGTRMVSNPCQSDFWSLLAWLFYSRHPNFKPEIWISTGTPTSLTLIADSWKSLKWLVCVPDSSRFPDSVDLFSHVDNCLTRKYWFSGSGTSSCCTASFFPFVGNFLHIWGVVIFFYYLVLISLSAVLQVYTQRKRYDVCFLITGRFLAVAMAPLVSVSMVVSTWQAYFSYSKQSECVEGTS